MYLLPVLPLDLVASQYAEYFQASAAVQDVVGVLWATLSFDARVIGMRARVGQGRRLQAMLSCLIASESKLSAMISLGAVTMTIGHQLLSHKANFTGDVYKRRCVSLHFLTVLLLPIPAWSQQHCDGSPSLGPGSLPYLAQDRLHQQRSPASLII